MDKKEANNLSWHLYDLLEAIAYSEIRDQDIHILLDRVLKTKPRNFKTKMTIERTYDTGIEVLGLIEIDR